MKSELETEDVLLLVGKILGAKLETRVIVELARKTSSKEVVPEAKARLRAEQKAKFK